MHEQRFGCKAVTYLTTCASAFSKTRKINIHLKITLNNLTVNKRFRPSYLYYNSHRFQGFYSYNSIVVIIRPQIVILSNTDPQPALSKPKRATNVGFVVLACDNGSGSSRDNSSALQQAASSKQQAARISITNCVIPSNNRMAVFGREQAFAALQHIFRLGQQRAIRDTPHHQECYVK